MSCQRSFWFHVPLTKQSKRVNAGHKEATINNAATVVVTCFENTFFFFFSFDLFVTNCICENCSLKNSVLLFLTEKNNTKLENQ